MNHSSRLVSFALAGLSFSTQPFFGEDLQLRPGPPLEREITPGEVHDYSIELRAQFVRLSVEQKGADVSVTLVCPGRDTFTIDSPTQKRSFESLLITGEGGQVSCRVEVRAFPGKDPPGSYSVEIQPLPSITERDRRRIAAERLITEAGTLYAQGSEESRREATARLEAAIPIWRMIDRPQDEAYALSFTGYLSRVKQEFSRALGFYSEALPLWQGVGDHYMEADTLNSMGYCLWSLGRGHEALEHYQQALDLWEGLNETDGKAMTLVNVGLVHQNRGDPRKALSFYGLALPLYRQLGDSGREALTINNIGGIYQALGEPDEALAHYAEALEAYKALGDRRGEALVLGNQAYTFRASGNFQQAVDGYGQALAIRQELADRREVAKLLNNLGEAYFAMGDSEKALQYLNDSLALRRQVEDRRGEAITLHNLGLVTATDFRDLPKALDLFGRARDLARTVGDRHAEALAIAAFGWVRFEMGQHEQALQDLETACTLLHDMGDRRREGETLLKIGKVHVAAGRAEEGRRSIQKSLELVRETRDRSLEAFALLSLAQAERGLARASEAVEHARDSLEVIESLRGGVLDLRLRISFLSSQQNAYEFTIDLLMELHRREPSSGWDRAALEVSEQARARSLLDLLEEAGMSIRHGADPELLARRDRLRRQLDAKAARRMELLDQPGNEARRAELEREITVALQDLEAVDVEIRRKSPGYAALTRPEPLGAAAIQKLLDPGTALLVYFLGEARSFLWSVTAKSIASFELPPRAAIEAAAREVHERWGTLDLRKRKEDEQAAARLSGMLLGPLIRHPAGPRLVVVADGALQFIAFAALPLPGDPERQPLLTRYEVVSLPSPSTLGLQRQMLAARAPARDGIAVLADPVFDRRDPRVRPSSAAAESAEPEAFRSAPSARSEAPIFDRLSWSRDEAEAIQTLAGAKQSRIVLDFDANLDAIAEDRLRDYAVLHFATHGVVDNAHPELSGLVLSLVDPAGNSRPGFLHLLDVYNLRLAADLVVLSGCETALGKEVRGEGLIGLTRGFMYAGAERVMASLWRVQDRSTAELMRRFYQGLLVGKLPPAAALRQAQLSLRAERGWGDPYYWAPFIVSGDWR